ncbi:hypothetical protein F4819DRAFT_472988 [Neofusicoccum parvum]|uniref:Uncharacterized protein n=1 Tax=Neofusicoccum parvum TaxID=310453 RepID=A0ACB5SB55_9PEZI|nr:hypothetical protein F4819DRAFT_472988 [Neofusicoccum parvum]
MAPENLFDIQTPTFPTIPDVVLNDPQNRRIKVITIGAGVAGILNAYNIQKQYPGCACDVPSHAYTYPFAPNPEWPRFLSKREDIWEYLDRVCKVFDLRKYMNFNVEVTEAKWDEDSAQWQVKLRRTNPDNSTEEFGDTCDLLLYCIGILNNWQWPEIEGLKDFKGRIIHTARWPEEYDVEQWKDQNVVVIGSGASSLQVVPSMQPHVNKMDIFIRTGVWFAPLVDDLPEDYQYSPDEIEEFRRNPKALVDHVKRFDSQLNAGWPIMFSNSEAQEKTRAAIKAKMSELIKEERLLKCFTPQFSVGCRRITPGTTYLHSIQQPNVSVHFTPVTRITPTCAIGNDGLLRTADTIICATGFDVSFRPRFPIIGRNGANLAELWKQKPAAYLGLTAPSMPNFAVQGGPPTPVQNGTPFGVFGAAAGYALHLIAKLQRENVRSVQPKREAADAFARHVEAFHRGSVFGDGCRSWYKDDGSGRVGVVWPGSALHYKAVLATPRWEDYEIEYRDVENRFSWMGLGFVKEQRTPGADLGHYLKVENIDPRWMKEMGMTAVPERKGGEGND